MSSTSFESCVRHFMETRWGLIPICQIIRYSKDGFRCGHVVLATVNSGPSLIELVKGYVKPGWHGPRLNRARYRGFRALIN